MIGADTISWTLELDLGRLRPGRIGQTFAVLLDGEPVRALVDAARRGSRVFELMSLQRPGDLLEHIDVRMTALPIRLAPWWHEASRPRAGEEAHLSFDEFDRHFQWLGDDTPAEHEAWRDRWEGPDTRAFLARLMQAVDEAKAGLPGSDELMDHELRRIQAGQHAHQYRPLATIRRQTDFLRAGPGPELHAAGFYGVLASLLLQPAVESVSYRPGDDYRVLRMMCNEQRRRADEQGCSPGAALALCNLANRRVDNDAWGSELLMYEEGMGWGDLWIEGHGDPCGAPLRELLGNPWQKFGRWVLAASDLGELPGYAQESGPGWNLYEALSGTALPRPPKEQEKQEKRA
ncbi:hypothetical protein [Pelomonas sp. KK5]|uniref:hypothetical protein n=1 Tax=Pelomonas sp. KK5 TaxID=1855730 RepID=UPI00097BD54C|nr:hypothetical protein [Pelomonas sp. KK5]